MSQGLPNSGVVCLFLVGWEAGTGCSGAPAPLSPASPSLHPAPGPAGEDVSLVTKAADMAETYRLRALLPGCSWHLFGGFWPPCCCRGAMFVVDSLFSL